MKLGSFTKQPSEYKDYDIHYGPWLIPVNDTIDDASISIECLSDPDDISLVCDSYEYTNNTLKLWMVGGTPTYKYKVTVLLSTVIGRVDESEIIFKIKDF